MQHPPKPQRQKPPISGTNMAAIFGLYRLNRPDFHIMIDYHGHCGLISVRAFAGGWRQEANPTGDWLIFLADPDVSTKIQATVAEVIAHAQPQKALA